MSVHAQVQMYQLVRSGTSVSIDSEDVDEWLPGSMKIKIDMGNNTITFYGKPTTKLGILSSDGIIDEYDDGSWMSRMWVTDAYGFQTEMYFYGLGNVVKQIVLQDSENGGYVIFEIKKISSGSSGNSGTAKKKRR